MRIEELSQFLRLDMVLLFAVARLSLSASVVPVVLFSTEVYYDNSGNAMIFAVYLIYTGYKHHLE